MDWLSVLAVSLTALLLVHNAAAAGNRAEILDHPSSKMMPVGLNVTFICNTRASEVNWWFNGRIWQEEALRKERGFEFRSLSRDGMVNKTVTIPTAPENNNTVISCWAILINTESHSRAQSRNATLTVYDNAPVVPNPVVLAQNENTLVVSWSPVFLWPGFQPEGYNISVLNTATGDAVFHTSFNSTNMSHHYLSSFPYEATYNSNDHEMCVVFQFEITAIGVNGIKQTAAMGGFPVAPGPMDFDNSAINSTVYFYRNDTPAYVSLQIKLPYVCDYQDLGYTITIEEVQSDGAHSHKATIGPNQRQGPDPRVISETFHQGLEKERNYSVQLNVETVAGNVSSHKHFFDTHFPKDPTHTEEEGNTTMLFTTVMSVSVGVAILMTTVVVILSVLKCKQNRKRKTVRHKSEAAKKAVSVMVHNPIYDGPIYDSIHQEFDPSHLCTLTAGADTDLSDSPRYLYEPTNSMSCEYPPLPNSNGTPASVPASPPKNDLHSDKSLSVAMAAVHPEQESSYTLMSPVGALSTSLNGGWGDLPASYTHQQ